jgi:hypothetical protein
MNIWGGGLVKILENIYCRLYKSFGKAYKNTVYKKGAETL